MVSLDLFDSFDSFDVLDHLKQNNMKILSIILLGLGIGIGVSACSEDKLSGYASDSYIYFTKESTDSTIFSFAYDKSKTEGELKLKLNMVSGLEDRDRSFSVRFLADKSTAKEGVHFELEDDGQMVMANDSIGYLTLKVMKADLNKNTVKAVFELVASEDFEVGLRSNSRANVIISDQLNRPAWWDEWHETDGLGAYSDLKYQAFIEETGVYDLSQEEDGGSLSYSEVRVLVLKFKRALALRPRPDVDGSDMSVAMRG